MRFRGTPLIEPPHEPPPLAPRSVLVISVLALVVLSWYRPPPAAAELPAIVEDCSCSEPAAVMPPPLAEAVLPVIVDE